MTKKRSYGGRFTGALSRGVAVAIGIVLGLFLHQKINESFPTTEPLVKAEGYWLTTPDVVAIVVSFLVMVFGGKMHRFVRWIGVGMFAGCIATELSEVMFHKTLTFW